VFILFGQYRRTNRQTAGESLENAGYENAGHKSAGHEIAGPHLKAAKDEPVQCSGDPGRALPQCTEHCTVLMSSDHSLT